jgi:hypothetical protein
MFKKVKPSIYSLLLYATFFALIATNVLSQEGYYGTSSANNTVGSAPTLNLSSINTCSDVGNLKTGKIQVRNFSGSTLDSYNANQTCYDFTHTNSSTYKNMWFKFTAGSGVYGVFLYSTLNGVSPIPTSSTNLRTGYFNVYTSSATGSCTALNVCSSTYTNIITSYTLSSPYIDVQSTEIIDVTPGTTYWVELWTLSTSTDPNYNFDINVVPTGQNPANQLCSGATSFSGSVPTGCNLGAYRACQTSPSTACWNTLENSVFYYFTRPAGASFQIQINSVVCQAGGVDLQTAVFRATTANCVTNLNSSSNMIANKCISSGSSYTYTISNADPAGTTYVIWMDGNTGAVCKWGITVLPINLVSFDAVYDSFTVNLSWQTATESSNDYFTIQRSPDGVDWETIGSVDGAGFSNELLTYEFVDRSPLEGINYYRLKQVDFDGEFMLSEERSISTENLKEVVVLPNPNNGHFKILNLMDGDKVSITSVSGIQFFENKMFSNSIEIDLENVPNGIYFLRVNNVAVQRISVFN